MIATDRYGNSFDLLPKDCPICGTAPRKRLGCRGGASQRERLGVETTIYECRSCGLVFPDPFPFPCDPQKLYGDPEKYFPDVTEAQKLQACDAVVRELHERAGRAGLRVLDVGAGRGEFLESVRRAGSRGVGLEFSDAMIAAARARYNIEVVKSPIEDFAASGVPPFDVVTMNAVLEHVYEPAAMIRAASILTNRGGLLYIDVPNEPNLVVSAGNLYNRVLGRDVVYNLQPTWRPFHVYGFNPRSLATLLRRHGFRVDAMRIWADVKVPSTGGAGDQLKAAIATQIGHLANRTRTAANLFAWATKI